MRRCPKCDQNTAASILTILERGSDGKTFSHYRRRFKCKTCGHIFTTYEFYIDADRKANLLRLARLGREFIEFKVQWRKDLQEEIRRRKQLRKEYQEEKQKLKQSKKTKKSKGYDELLDLENIIIKGEEDNE